MIAGRLRNAVRAGSDDALVAWAWLVALEVELVITGPGQGPLVLRVLLVTLMGAAAFWRSAAPLTFVVAASFCGIALAATGSSPSGFVGPTYLLIFVPYAVAKEARPTPALAGLAAVLTFGVALNASSTSPAGWYLGAAAMSGAAWSVGRWLRVRRGLNDMLEDEARRIEAERASRVRLAIADERTRIARELHTVVASNVSAMVIQAEAAELLLAEDRHAADRAMAAVEHTGRDALSDMRRLLGVLRRSDELPALAPQPGVGELYALVETARSTGRTIGISVEGEPGPLPASVDVSIYRLVEEALDHGGSGEADIRLEFRREQINLEISVVARDASSSWPTSAMRERAEICNASIHGEVSGDRRRLHTSFPRARERAFA